MGKSHSKPISKSDATANSISDNVAILSDQSDPSSAHDVIETDQSEPSKDTSVFTKFRRSISSLIFKDNEDNKDNFSRQESSEDSFSRQVSTASTGEERKRKGDQQAGSKSSKMFKMDQNIVNKTLDMKISEDAREAFEEELVDPNEALEEYLDFPFLNDEDTVNFFNSSLVMLVMRGLPGSGKSTVVRAVKKKYPQAVSCSADDYFYQNGVYEFQKEKIKDAHAYCQQKTEDHCKKLTRLVIIDNTHVQRWEAVPYFKMANKYRYLVVLVEPKTPWRLDVDQLANRNSHNVNWKTVKQRCDLYAKSLFTPYYFGWFLNLADSKFFIESPQSWLKKCLHNCPDFLVDFQNFSNCYDLKSMLNYFDRDSVQGMGKNVCHCTAKFCGKEGREYATKQIIVDNLGGVTSLEITGFTITPRTIGARVKLNDDQKLVYAQNDTKEEQPTSNLNSKPQNSNKQHQPKKKNVQNGHETAAQDDDDPMELEESAHLFGAISASKPSLRTRKSEIKCETSDFCSIFGRRAHITLGCAAGVKPVQTGVDTIDIGIKEALEAVNDVNKDGEAANEENKDEDLETAKEENKYEDLEAANDAIKDSDEVSKDNMDVSEEALEKNKDCEEVSKEDVEKAVDVFPKYKVPGGVLTNYGEGSWLFNLDKHIVVDAVFTGGW